MARPWWPLEKRFAAKVAKERNENGCLLWKGNKNPKGYGLILKDGTGTPLIIATQAALIVIGVELPKDFGHYNYGIFHTCDVPACIYTGSNDGGDDGTYIVDGIEYPRWGHLWFGPKKANNRDMWNKGRTNWQVDKMPDSHGTRNVNSKLNDDLVRRMRAEYRYGGGSYTHIAKLHGISISTTQRAIEGITWRHVI